MAYEFYGGEGGGAYWVLVGKSEGGRPLIDGRIILKLIFEKWDRGIDLVDLRQVWDRYRVGMNAVRNLRLP